MTNIESVQQDGRAMSVAQAVAVANKAALAENMTPDDFNLTIDEIAIDSRAVWRVYFGPRNRRQRAGDMTVYVEQDSGKVERVELGQ